ncbi:hypothetical protein MIZ03_0824 [Rhodoferax lithotrophicus]|uniref:Transposase n=1 Tax=Rhodoferax lithotrophicus TaxID=2798804 RepID=A0ABN6D1X1_9BURK|nr:hypothetical protein [Rhodoferax sp. MIZ03]BCO25945.1 hypothetical protein MIZ03_0824 [Rhodoferax sp. MIZ03]
MLASACKGKKLKVARLALQMPALNPQALESAQVFMARVSKMDVGLCPVCKVGHLRTVEVLAGARQLPVPGSLAWPQERGPPWGTSRRLELAEGFTSAAKLAGARLCLTLAQRPARRKTQRSGANAWSFGA